MAGRAPLSSSHQPSTSQPFPGIALKEVKGTTRLKEAKDTRFALDPASASSSSSSSNNSNSISEHTPVSPPGSAKTSRKSVRKSAAVPRSENRGPVSPLAAASTSAAKSFPGLIKMTKRAQIPLGIKGGFIRRWFESDDSSPASPVITKHSLSALLL